MYVSHFSNAEEGNFIALATRLSSRAFTKTLAAVNRWAEKFQVPGIELPAEALSDDNLGVRCWRPELGAVNLGLQRSSSRDDWAWLSAQTRLASFLCGLIPSLDLSVRGTRPLFLAGHMVQGRDLAVRADGNVLEVFDGDDALLLGLKKVVLPGMAPLWVPAPDPEVVRLGSGAATVFADGAWEGYWYPGASPMNLTPDREASRRTIEETLATLEEHLPPSYLWVSLLLAELVPLREPKPGTTNSGSSGSWPGHVYLSQASVLQTIIMLVHECSHQYFHLLLWNASLVVDGAPEVYSVLKQTRRPLSKLLLGYHAFANVLLVLARLRELKTGIDPAEIDAQIYSVGRLVAELDAVVLAHCDRFINERGKSLYLPLRDRLAEAVRRPPAVRRAS
jgi:HEXXH motif-containing protein